MTWFLIGINIGCIILILAHLSKSDQTKLHEIKPKGNYDDYVKIIGNYRFRLDAVMPECIYIFKDVTKIPEDDYSDIFLLNQFGSFKVYYPRTD